VIREQEAVRRLSAARIQEKTTLKRFASAAVAAVIAGGLGGQAMAHGTPQTVAIMKVDPQTVATGFRSSKIVGSSVVNEANETVGSVDDLIVTPNEKAPYAVLSVGGFLGLGTKYVIVPFGSLQMQDKKIVLPGATKDALKALPEFKYSS
jgi:PRC-barrel domain